MTQELNFKTYSGYPMLQTQERLPENQFRFTIIHTDKISVGDKLCTFLSPLKPGVPNGYIVEVESVNDVKFPQHHKKEVKNYTVIAQLEHISQLF